MRRQWQTFPNYAYSITAQKDILFTIKNVLTNTNSVSNTLDSSAIWTVVSSSNSTTTSSSDLWTSTTAVVRNTAGAVHSWIVMYNATLGLYLTLDYVGSLNYACDAVLSTDAPSGGTTGARPTVTNGVSFTWSFDRPTLVSETRYFSMTADTLGGFVITQHRNNGEQVVICMLSAIYGEDISDPIINRPQSGLLYDSGFNYVFMQCGGNQTGNAHLMTPTGTNVGANLFAANGGKVRLLGSSGNSQAAPVYAAAMKPPFAITSAATEAVFFGTANGGATGSGVVAVWPLMVTCYANGSYFATVRVPDFYVTTSSTSYTAVAANSGGVGYTSSSVSDSTPINYFNCNGLYTPWGATTTAPTGGQWLDNIPIRRESFPLTANFGGSKDNRISARNGRGVGGW
jgi:hypothetical protein